MIGRGGELTVFCTRTKYNFKKFNLSYRDQNKRFGSLTINTF